MNFRKILLTLITFLVMFASCVKIDNTYDNRIPINNKGEYAIVFSSSNTATKAVVSSVSGTGYDAFNLYCWNSINNDIMIPYRVEFDGTDNAYKYDNISGQKLEYYKSAADWYDFIGIIPTANTTSINNHIVKVEGVESLLVDDNRVSGTITADSNKEFLYAYKRVEKANYGSVAVLPFEHGNALLYLGFSSDRDDTQLIDYVPGQAGAAAVPAVIDTTYTLKIGNNLAASAGPTKTVSVEDLALINSMFTLNVTDWPTSSSAGNVILTVQPVSSTYSTYIGTRNVTTYYNANIKYFDAVKYLKEKYSITEGTWNNWGPQIQQGGGILVHVAQNSNGTLRGWFWNPDTQLSVPIETVITPGTPGTPAVDKIEGIRVFSADSTSTTYCVHIPHTIVADAFISSTEMNFDNRTTSDGVIQFSLPTTLILNDTPVWSATTFYGVPGDIDLNFFVVKLSYIYNGVTYYDVRVPIKLPDGGLKPGKYYKYELNITGRRGGTSDQKEASDEQDEIIIEGENPIIIDMSVNDYTEGANKKIIM